MKHSDFLSVRPLGLAAVALGLIASMSRSASADEYFIDNATIDHTVLYNAFVGWDGGSVYASPTVGGHERRRDLGRPPHLQVERRELPGRRSALRR